MIYDTFLLLCKKKGLSPSRAALEAQISKSLVTKWKTNGTEVPSPDVLKKLSDFFGVTPNYLLGYDTQKNPNDGKELKNMAKKTTPNITHTEIIALAIRSIVCDITARRSMCESFPEEQRDTMIAAATRELNEKLDALKTLYHIESGAEWEE